MNLHALWTTLKTYGKLESVRKEVLKWAKVLVFYITMG